MANSKRIIFVTELFYPDETSTSHILTSIALYAKREFEVLVVTGPEVYDHLKHEISAFPPIAIKHIFRVRLPRLSKNNLFARFLRNVLLAAGIGWYVVRLARPSDSIFAVTNPVLSLVLLALIRKFRQFRLVFLVHDVFPENAAAAQLLRQDTVLYYYAKLIFDWSYDSADAIITIGRDMSEIIAGKLMSDPAKIKFIPNWADDPLIERIPRHISMIPSMGLSNHIVIQYAGNIGRAQGLIEFVNLVSTIKSDVLHFVFRGSGAKSKELHKSIDCCNSFTLVGSYPRAQQSLVLASCDIALVILRPQMYGLAVPSKVYNIMASGKPILFLGPRNSEVYLLVKEHCLGWSFDWSETDLLLRFLAKLSFDDLQSIGEYGHNSRRLVETTYTESIQLAEYLYFFKQFCPQSV